MSSIEIEHPSEPLEDQQYAANTIKKEKRSWTVMIYMAGDNNLSENMAYALEEIRNVTDPSKHPDLGNVNVLAFFDGASLTAPTRFIDYSSFVNGEPHYEEPALQAPKAPGKTVKDPENSANPQSIVDFVDWCVKKRGCAAENYALIFSAHSFGFHGTSFLRDDSADSFMTLKAFRGALETIHRKTLGGKKISILGFDSCVMSMLEVGFELKDVAETMIASEGSLPNSGWGYASILGKLICGKKAKELQSVQPDKRVTNTAAEIVSSFVDFYKPLAIGGRSVDIAAWDLGKVETVVKAVDSLGDAFNQHILLPNDDDGKRDEAAHTKHEVTKSILKAHYDAQTYLQDQCVDLQDFCERVKEECDVMIGTPFEKVFHDISERAQTVVNAVRHCVLRSGYCGDEFQFSNGISIYFPWTLLAYTHTFPRYAELLFNSGNEPTDQVRYEGLGLEWNRFLYNYLTQATLRESRARDSRSIATAAGAGYARSSNAGEPSVGYLEPWSKGSPPWSKSNTPLSKSTAPWSKSTAPWSRSTAPWSRSTAPWSKSTAPWSRGELLDNLFHFGQFKNYELGWDISGFSGQDNDGSLSSTADTRK